MTQTAFRCALGLMMAVASAYAQIPQGAIVGRVVDASSASVAGAEVTLENQLTGVKRTSPTNAEGLYAFNYLESGLFRVTIKATGFNLGVYPDIRVQAGEKIRLDAELKIGDISTKVEVSGASALVQTESATVGQTVSQREVIDMPVRDREFSQLAVLVPGIRPAGTTGGALITQFATAIEAGGTSSSKNSYTIDGVDNTFNVWNGPAMNPSIDAIQEFRIERSLFSAEFGRGGAQLHLITKAGTNDYHGVMWEYMRNYNLNAGNWASGQRDTLKRHQFGANLGGPIIKNKLFFFFNWESQRERSTSQLLGSVFTDEMRQGNFNGYPRPTRDPLTNQPFPNNVIPRDRLNTVSLAYLDAMMPAANRAGFVNNFLRIARTTRDWDQYISRADWQVSGIDSLFFRFNYQPREGISAPLAATSINHGENFKFLNAGAGWNRTWSSRTLSETRFGFQRQRLLLASLPGDKLPTTPILGFGSVQPPPERLPVINIADTSGFHQWGFPLGFYQNSIEIIQNATFYRGSHIVKAGFFGRRQMLHKDKGPQYQITGNFTGAYSGTGPADYLLGIPFSASESLKFNVAKQYYGDYSFFAQDDWKVTPSLTVNLGLRYELNTLPSEENNLWGNFDPDRQKIVLAGDKINEAAISDPVFFNAYRNVLITANQTNLPNRSLVFMDKNNLSPRVGFAWRPFKNNKTVFRGGYGIYYLLEDGNTAFNNTGTLPYGGAVSTQNTTPTPRFTFNAPFGAGIADLPKPGASYRHPYMRTPYLQQLTFSIQRELPWNMLFDATFQDQNSLKLETSWGLNIPRPGTGALDPRRPFQDFGPSIGSTFHDGHQRYDALELSVRKQTRHLTFQWSHVWAKNMSRLSPVNPYDREAFVGPSGYIPHLSKMHFIADLPFGKGRTYLNMGGPVDYLLGGWTISGFALLQSGTPLTPTWNADSANVGIATVRPNRIGDGSVSDPTMARWIDPAAFAAPTALTFGNSGTGIIRGPSAQSFDMSIHKNFVFFERYKLQFRAESFNAFNHPNYSSPNLSVNGLRFGEILTKTASLPRVYQMALRLAF